jgi:hypothetical protein
MHNPGRTPDPNLCRHPGRDCQDPGDMDVSFQLTCAHKACLPWQLGPGIHAGMTNILNYEMR